LAVWAVSQSDRPGDFDPPPTHLKARAADAQLNFAPARQRGVTSHFEQFARERLEQLACKRLEQFARKRLEQFARKRFGRVFLLNSFFGTVSRTAFWNSFFGTSTQCEQPFLWTLRLRIRRRHRREYFLLFEKGNLI